MEGPGGWGLFGFLALSPPSLSRVRVHPLSTPLYLPLFLSSPPFLCPLLSSLLSPFPPSPFSAFCCHLSTLFAHLFYSSARGNRFARTCCLVIPERVVEEREWGRGRCACMHAKVPVPVGSGPGVLRCAGWWGKRKGRRRDREESGESASGGMSLESHRSITGGPSQVSLGSYRSPTGVPFLDYIDDS